MIKKHLFLLILSTIFNVLHAQDEKKIKLEFGEESMFENSGTFVSAMMKDKAGNIYCVKDKPSGFVIGTGISDASIGSVKHKFFLEIYSPTLKKLLSKEVEIPNAQAKIFVNHTEWGSGIIRGLTVNDEPYLLITYVEKKSKTRLIQATKINADGTFDTPKPLCELPNEGKDYSRSYRVLRSKDDSKLMIVGIPDVKAKQNVQYYVSVLSNNFEPIWSRGFALPIKENRNEGANFYIGNTGRMYMQTYEEITKKANKDDPNIKVTFYTFAKKDLDLKIMSFDFPANRYLEFYINPDSLDINATCYVTFTKDTKEGQYHDPRNKYRDIYYPTVNLTGMYVSRLNLTNGISTKKEIFLDKNTINYFKPEKISKNDKDKAFGPLINIGKYSTDGIASFYSNGSNENIISIQTTGIILSLVVDSTGNKISESFVKHSKYSFKEINPSIFSNTKKGENIIITTEGLNEKEVIKCNFITSNGSKSFNIIDKGGNSIKYFSKGGNATLYWNYLKESKDSLILILEKDKKYKLVRLSFI
jgi:hypothetical protein